MAGNKAVMDNPTVPDPEDAYLYVVKSGLDYKVKIGGNLSLAFLGATGQFPVAQVPDLPASKITSGTINYAQIPNLGVEKITSGVFDPIFIPNLDAAKITTGIFTATRIPSLDASKITTGTLPNERIASIDAGKITTGTVNPNRLGSGTPSSTTFLRGDNSWQVVSTGSATWGSITGTLSSQTDLDSALAAKAPTSTTVTTNTTQTVTGAKTLTDLDVTGVFGRKNANSATITDQPRIFVQAGDPGAAAAENDIWLW